MKQANTAQTSQRAASVRIARLLAVVAVALFVVTFVAQAFAVHP
jgi:uncharacterized membrane protein YtjA (UPF0391 family)